MRDHLTDAMAGWVYPIALISMLSTPAIWTYQIYHWLRFGKWDAIPVSEGLQFAGLVSPQFSWAGVQMASDWIMTLPLSIFLFLSILAVIVIFSEWGDRRDNRARLNQ